MYLQKKEITKIQNINFHDAEIAKIVCDYYEGTVEMPIIMFPPHDTKKYGALLKFEKIVHVEVTRKEPWGSGMYIFEVNIDKAEDDYFRVSILLNSGDEVNIIAAKMIYSESE